MHDRIHQEHSISATPDVVYAALTGSTTFGEMTGRPAVIDPTAGGEFSIFGGVITGRNIECVPGARLVQAWRASYWDEGVYSVARFELRADGDGCRVVLDHTGYPEGAGETLDAGWHPNYWEPLAKRFG